MFFVNPFNQSAEAVEALLSRQVKKSFELSVPTALNLALDLLMIALR